MQVLLLEITKCVQECESAFVAIFSLKNSGVPLMQPLLGHKIPDVFTGSSK